VQTVKDVKGDQYVDIDEPVGASHPDPGEDKTFPRQVR